MTRRGRSARQLVDLDDRQQHRHHDSVISAMHVHLDHHNCLEVLAVRGTAHQIRKLADDLIATKGVKHGKLTMTSTGRILRPALPPGQDACLLPVQAGRRAKP